MAQADAMDLLGRANAALAALRARIPGESDFWNDVNRYCEDSPEWRASHAELLMDLFELRSLLRRVDPEAR
jgi:hypothetical protein